MHNCRNACRCEVFWPFNKHTKYTSGSNSRLLKLECKLLSVILIAAQLMQPFSALSATHSGIFLTKRTSFLGNGFEVVFASVQPYCFVLAEQLVRRDAFWDSPLLPGLLLFLFEIEYNSCRLSLHGHRTCKQPQQKG